MVARFLILWVFHCNISEVALAFDWPLPAVYYPCCGCDRFAGESGRRQGTLTACQDDRTLKETLMPIVAKLTDVRLANGEIKATLSAARTEYYMMAGMVAANIPLLYVLNKDWYHALMYTIPGQIVLAVCGMAILVTYLWMNRFTKPIAYQK